MALIDTKCSSQTAIATTRTNTARVSFTEQHFWNHGGTLVEHPITANKTKRNIGRWQFLEPYYITRRHLIVINEVTAHETSYNYYKDRIFPASPVRNLRYMTSLPTLLNKSTYYKTYWPQTIQPIRDQLLCFLKNGWSSTVTEHEHRYKHSRFSGNRFTDLKIKILVTNTKLAKETMNANKHHALQNIAR